MVKIERLTDRNFTEFSLDSYNRTQDVKRVWRKKDGKYILVDMPYTEDWTLERKRLEAKFLSSGEYISYIALDEERVVGFAGVKKRLVRGYMVLDMMHVDAGYRGRGLGRQLFERARTEAQKAGAKALYISACSSEETIAFYRAMGAEVTEDVIKEMAEEEPYDLQMLCKV